MRPAVAIGHVGPVTVSNLTNSLAFYAALGMRTVGSFGRMAILELRGGTHLILRHGDARATALPFDLMVDDVHGAREECIRQGWRVSDISEGGVHETFVLEDPDGHRVNVTSSHAIGPV